jgi:hypothetical protein
MRAKRRQTKLTRKKRVSRLVLWDPTYVDFVDCLPAWSNYSEWKAYNIHRRLTLKERAARATAKEQFEELGIVAQSGL